MLLTPVTGAVQCTVFLVFSESAQQVTVNSSREPLYTRKRKQPWKLVPFVATQMVPPCYTQFENNGLFSF